MDTAKDGRILILEDALRRLNEIVGNRKMKMHIDYGKLGDALKTAGSLLYEVKYSYMDAPALADQESTANLVATVKTFEETYRKALGSGYKPSTVKEHITHIEVEYALRIVRGFQDRLRKYPDDPGFSVDILAVEVSSVRRVEGSSNLSECRCTDGSRIWQIITNISGVKVGSKMACAILPPVEMMNSVSEAMFLGSTPLAEDLPSGPLNSPPESALDQSRAQVLQITKRMV
ncbi:MAG: hypothetical protein P1Q69_01240 [Candidatus Thorarchaeota archaeon]|nr:hypothetical protein [Candidatus Thorarchaeota archaeon]